MNLLSIVPLVGSTCAVLAFCTAYIVAVARGDVYPWWPYISDTGTTIPESCIFGELLTMAAIIGLGGMIIRYKWVQLFNPDKNKKLTRLNSISIFIGALSCLAMTLVANFQETSLRAVHMPSAVATFGLGLVYNFIHTEITRVMSPRYSSVCVWGLRLCISMTGLIAFVLLYSFGISAEARGRRWFGNDSSKKLDWDPQDPGWGLHLVASVSEWIIGLSVILFFLTFVSEFSKIKLSLKAEPVQVETTTDETSPLLTAT